MSFDDTMAEIENAPTPSESSYDYSVTINARPEPKSAVSPGASDESFVRIEDKYLVPRDVAPMLIDLLETHLLRDRGNEFTHIESIYFDSDALDIYKSHFEQLPRRFKLRIRRYAPNGVPLEDANHLEMKLKENGISKKYRFKIGSTDIELLRAAKPIPVSIGLQKLNPQMETKTLLKRLKAVNEAVVQYKLRPMCSVKYVRKGYEKDGFRVTLDDNIRLELLRDVKPQLIEEIGHAPIWEKASSMRETFVKSDSIVLEVKHSNNVPSWMSKFLSDNKIGLVSLSKYCATLSDHMAHQLERTS